MILLYDRASLRNKCYITGIVKKQKPCKLYICFPLFPSVLQLMLIILTNKNNNININRLDSTFV